MSRSINKNIALLMIVALILVGLAAPQAQASVLRPAPAAAAAEETRYIGSDWQHIGTYYSNDVLEKAILLASVTVIAGAVSTLAGGIPKGFLPYASDITSIALAIYNWPTPDGPANVYITKHLYRHKTEANSWRYKIFMYKDATKTQFIGSALGLPFEMMEKN